MRLPIGNIEWQLPIACNLSMNHKGQIAVIPNSDFESSDLRQADSRYRQGADVWRRARVNSLAHRLAAEHNEKLGLVMSTLVTLATVIPIVAVALSLFYVTAASKAPAALTGSVLFGLSYTTLSVIAIGANGCGLFLGMLSKETTFSEKASQHRTLMSSYNIIAQKARRFESAGVAESDEGRHLLRNLQETFEIYKSSLFEPNEKMFERAQQLIPTLKPLPFGMTS